MVVISLIYSWNFILQNNNDDNCNILVVCKLKKDWKFEGDSVRESIPLESETSKLTL